MAESDFGRNCVSVYKYPTSICKQLWLYCWKSLKAVPLFSIITTFKHFQLVQNQLLANWQLYNSIISFEWTRFRRCQMQATATTAAGCRFDNDLFIPEHSTACILLSTMLASEVETVKWIFLNVPESMTHRKSYCIYLQF